MRPGGTRGERRMKATGGAGGLQAVSVPVVQSMRIVGLPLGRVKNCQQRRKRNEKERDLLAIPLPR